MKLYNEPEEASVSFVSRVGWFVASLRAHERGGGDERTKGEGGVFWRERRGGGMREVVMRGQGW